MTTVILSEKSKVKLSYFDHSLVKTIDRIKKLLAEDFHLSRQDLLAFPEWEKLQSVFSSLLVEKCATSFADILQKFENCRQLERDLFLYELAVYLPLAYTKGEVFSDKLLCEAFFELNQAFNDLSKKIIDLDCADQNRLWLFHEKIQAYLQAELL